jgi:hypothetical protein
MNEYENIQRNEKWMSEKHTVPEPTNTFGKIKFTGFGSDENTEAYVSTYNSKQFFYNNKE